jgi:16S rRNA A1518/A1519 N6-dimethyltransferase RsmA/KsgA/DIM1 with predicted DNA glycosylase/AP lyase activity
MDHRIELVDFWGIKPGSRVLELGCGQGDCTVVLADAVGETGHVDAVDPGAPDYGKQTLSSYFNVRDNLHILSHVHISSLTSLLLAPFPYPITQSLTKTQARPPPSPKPKQK